MSFTKKVLFLALGLTSLHTAVAQTIPPVPEPTLASVEASIDTYLELLQNGTIPLPEESAGVAKRFFKLPTGCELACGFLNFIKPKDTFYSGESAYIQGGKHWSEQQIDATPTCRYAPQKAVDVSVAVLTSRTTQCKFAVKSGGHAPHKGASSLDDGLVIDLKNFKSLDVAADRKSVSFGPGNLWYDVYSQLDTIGLTVVGGRASSVGTGGLTLGGGIAYISSERGWSCDNVIEYEVVMADGSIKIAKATGSTADLFWALRGGGNNFGVVTKFTVNAYEQGGVWGGSQTYVFDETTEDRFNTAFVNMANNMPGDRNAQSITTYAWSSAAGIKIINSLIQYTKPVAFPPILNEVATIEGTKVASTLRFDTLPGLTLELNATSPFGFRQTYWTLAVHADKALMKEMNDIFWEENEAIKNVPSITNAIIYQPIGVHMTEFWSRNGGNPMGIDMSKGPLNLINLSVQYAGAENDNAVMAAVRNVVNRCSAAAVARGLDNPFLYQNYASLEQKVFESYGAVNHQKLKDISKKYDPSQVFQKLSPGHFKL